MFMSRTSADGYLGSERQRVGFLEKRKLVGGGMLRRQRSEMEPSKVNLSPDPQSEPVKVVVSLYGYTALIFPNV